MDANVVIDPAVLKSVEAVTGMDPLVLLAGVGLIALAIFVVFFLKRVIENIALGLVALAVLKFFGVDLPLVPTLVVTLIFGLAGVGTMLVLLFFGLI